MKILLLIALPIEVSGFDFNQENVDVIFTGVGKINAYSATSKALRDKHYDIIINAGTCGSAKHEVGKIIFPSIINQGDAFITESFNSPVYEVKKQTAQSVKQISILSSDNFVSVKSETGSDIFYQYDNYDAFDMESFAIASAAAHNFALDNTIFIKIVSDNLDGTNADWETSTRKLAPILSRCIESFIKDKFIPNYAIRRI